MSEHLCPHCGKPILSREARQCLDYMRKKAPLRGGYMFEATRMSYDAGKYQDAEIAELLTVGAIAPHPDPGKGWVVAWRTEGG